MVGQHGIKLALNLIAAHFGNLVTKVCECLLHKGSLTLEEIGQFTELPPEQVKNGLLVLIQHNCVQAFTFSTEDDQGVVQKGTHYTVIFNNILHRMRFPKFTAIVSEQLDKECGGILWELLKHGRLTLDQIMSKRTEGDCAVQEVLHENFKKLVSARYVEPCAVAVSIPEPQDENANSLIKKCGAIPAKSAEPEQQVVTAAISSERFSVGANTGNDFTSEANIPGKPSNVTIGEKRKLEALEADARTETLICEKEVPWRANFEEFVSDLRHKACVASIRSRYDEGAGIVLNSMLELTRKEDKKVKAESSVPLARDAIFNEVIKCEEGCSMTLEHVEMVLKELGCDHITLEQEALYSIDLKNIIEIDQNDEVESLVSRRYGKDAYRMFRFLSKAAQFKETGQISDTTFVEKKDALKILYNLWKDDYLHMEKIIAHGSTQSEFLLWKVNKSSVREHVFDELCHAALNLRVKLAHELEQEHEILQPPSDRSNGVQEKRGERKSKVQSVLESSLMKIDEALLLFNDF